MRPVARRARQFAWLFLLACRPSGAQEIRWQSEATFYGDNTEFFTPYRTGETILGAQAKTYLSILPGPKTEIQAGIFADHRSGGDEFADPVRLILSFRYHGRYSLGVLGTLETHDRHGFLEPLEVTTLEFTRPVEYGVQWVETRPGFSGEAFLNWQHLNTATSREIFDYGLIVRKDLAGFLAAEAQLHGVHHGGQLHDVGPVTNDVAFGPGLRLSRQLPVAGKSSLRVFELFSKGKRDLYTGGPTIDGHGTWIKGSVEPGGFVELFGIWWRGKNFISTEGDNNYNSTGSDPAFYRADRSYQELGLVKKFTIERGITFDGEARLHRIDGKVEYSYRIVVRAPLDIPVRRPSGGS